MRRRWQIVLPIIGLLLFATETYDSVRQNRNFRKSQDQYFYWSNIRLDTDPLNMPRHSHIDPTKEDSTQESIGWDPQNVIVEPGPISKILVLSAIPAFAMGALVIAGLSRFGVNQLATFMVEMPVLLFAWYFFIGWLLDRRRYKRRKLKNEAING
jgi:hypothetical protein